MKEEILELARNLYIEGNSTREVSELILNNYNVKVNSEVLRRKFKKLGIIRDNSACQKVAKRRHLPIGEITNLYSQEQMSLRRLARKFISNKRTIHKILEENGVKVRSDDEAVRLANTKHKKSSFSGNACERAYMMGLIEGDITPNQKSKYTLRLTVSSTRSALVDLVKDVFEKYGPIYIYATKNNITNYKWNMTVELDYNSFSFLMNSKVESIKCNKNLMFSFISGLVDSDGSLFIRKIEKYFQYVLRIYNENLHLLKTIQHFLEKEKFNTSLQLFSKRGEIRKTKGKVLIYNNDYYVLEILRKKDLIRLLPLLSIKHPEKLLWKDKVRYIKSKEFKLWNEIEDDVECLRKYINKIYEKGLTEAKDTFESKHITPL